MTVQRVIGPFASYEKAEQWLDKIWQLRRFETKCAEWYIIPDEDTLTPEAFIADEYKEEINPSQVIDFIAGKGELDRRLLATDYTKE